ncbi:MAG: hypothetical protein COA94_03530 [Rickettsiales bacterium]|nr:MAG: hypothetical protein COA94_03530 [Rickettsiales bacterium]
MDPISHEKQRPSSNKGMENKKRISEDEILNDDRKALEREILNNTSTCSSGTIDLVSWRISPLNILMTKNGLRNNYYDPKVMESAACLVNSELDTNKNDVIGLRIKNWLTNLRIISEGVEGYALSVGLGNTKDVFVMKTPKSGNNLLHEFFVGIVGLNKLRKIIPNFVYTLGGFGCPAPIVQGEELVSWCGGDSDDSVDYILYENVDQSITLKEFILGGCSTDEYLNIYIQVLYALNIAGKEIDFMHYDLHTGNVLVRTISEDEVYVPYKIGESVHYLKTKYLAVIIDYGFSSIVHKGMDYGIYGFEDQGVGRHEPQLVDVTKLLSSSITDYLDKEQPNLGLGVAMGSISKLLDNNQDIHVEEFTYKMLREFDPKFVTFYKPYNVRVIGCGDVGGTDDCIEYKNVPIMKDEEVIKPSSILDLYDICFGLGKEEKYEQFDKMIESFDYKKHLMASMKEINSAHSKIEKSKRKYLKLKSIKRIMEFSWEYIPIYFNTKTKDFVNAIRVFRDTKVLILLIKSVHYASTIYNDVDTTNRAARYIKRTKTNNLRNASTISEMISGINIMSELSESYKYKPGYKDKYHKYFYFPLGELKLLMDSIKL